MTLLQEEQEKPVIPCRPHPPATPPNRYSYATMPRKNTSSQKAGRSTSENIAGKSSHTEETESDDPYKAYVESPADEGKIPSRRIQL